MAFDMQKAEEDAQAVKCIDWKNLIVGAWYTYGPIALRAASHLPGALGEIKRQAKQIKKLASENERLAEMFAKDTYIESAVMEPGYYNINTRGKGAMLLVGQLLQFFRDSGGKNFLTNTFQMEFADSKTYEHFELTIQKVNGEDSPAQKLGRQAKRIEELEAALKDANERAKKAPLFGTTRSEDLEDEERYGR